VINPVLERLRAEGMQLVGALPADTLFAKHHLSKADAVLAMYHDQGLPVLKHASFGEGVNVTLACLSSAPRLIMAPHWTWQAQQYRNRQLAGRHRLAIELTHAKNK